MGGEFEVKKIGEITMEQLNKLNKAVNKKKVFKEILGLSSTIKYEIGDTAISVNNAKELEVYENEWNHKNIIILL